MTLLIHMTEQCGIRSEVWDFRYGKRKWFAQDHGYQGDHDNKNKNIKDTLMHRNQLTI